MKKSLLDKLEIGALGLLSLGLFVWAGWSVADSLIPSGALHRYEVNVDSIDNYVNGLEEKTSGSAGESNDIETENSEDEAVEEDVLEEGEN